MYEVYLDESGDLGWRLDLPYRKGGSSQFLTIAQLIIPVNKKKHPKRIVRDLYNRKGWRTDIELKAANLKKDDRNWVIRKSNRLLDSHKDIQVVAITTKKKNVKQHIRKDPNKLYNYMIKLSLLEYIKNYEQVRFIPDERTIKVKSRNSLPDYLQTCLWFDWDVNTTSINNPQESKNVLNLQFIDYLANIVWRNYEIEDKEPFNTLLPYISNKVLFF